MRAVGTVFRLALVAAVIATFAGSLFWFLEDDQGRDDIQRALHDLPLVGGIVSDPDSP